MLAAAPIVAYPAYAGTYVLSSTDSNGDPSPTGGELDSTGSIAPVSYALIRGGYGAGASNHCAMSLSGPISSTYTWTPDNGKTLAQDPAPTQAIVHQHCDVYAWSSSNTDTLPDASADNGLGSTPDDEYVDEGNTQSNSSESVGDKYQVVTGGMTVTVPNCTPAGSADGSQSTGELSVTYTDDVTPVQVTLTGSTLDSSGGNNILIGQYCGAALSVGSYSVENYSWNVTGSTFASFNVAEDLSSGHMISVSDDTWTEATPGWYWRKDEGDTVTCTADVYIGSTFVGNVTASRSVTVQAPSYSFTQTYGAVVIGGNPPGFNGNNPSTAYYLVATASATAPRGSQWVANALTPYLFTSGGTSSGSWRFVQKITPRRIHFNPYEYDCTQNGIPGLDKSYPYGYDPTDPFNSGSGWASDGISHADGDTPATNMGNVISRVVVGDTFQTYMMYLPPGSNSSWVPLDVEPWEWTADDSIPGNPASWSNWPASTPAGTVQFGMGDSGRTYTFPDWDLVNSPSSGLYW